MFMPLNVRLRRVVLFGGERGEGRGKLDRLARFAQEILAVPETVPCRVEAADRVPPNVVFHGEDAASADLESLVRGASLVVSGLACRAMNERIAAVCRARGILVNVIDDKDLCDVYFTALVERPNLTLSVSTGGRCAFLAGEIRKELEDWARDRDAIAAAAAAAREAVDPALGRRERIERLRRAYFDPEVRLLARAGRANEAALRARVLAREPAGAERAKPAPLRTVGELAAELAAGIPRIAAADLDRDLSAGTAPRIVDVREPAEYAAARIAGAVNVPRGMLERWAADAHPHAGGSLLLASNREVRSGLAAATLRALGYRRVSVLLGGIEAWRREGGRLAEGTDETG